MVKVLYSNINRNLPLQWWKGLWWGIQGREKKWSGYIYINFVGVLVYPNGDRYEGDWVNGAKNGQGVLVYMTGDKYTGDWSNDKKDGKGKM